VSLEAVRSGSIIVFMVIDMNEAQVRTVQQIRQVLAGTQDLGFSPAQDEQQRYDWISSVLQRLHYRQLGRAERGVVLAYLRHLSGYSRAQINRLVARAMTQNVPLRKRYHATTACFARRYTDSDVFLLIEVDQAMGTLSGAATACVLRRMRDVYQDERFVRLGCISVSHLYNLRHSTLYRNQRVVQTKTRSTRASTIGVRRAPTPEGRPGFIRIDSVHQGDWDGAKGLYHINAVDCVTQWQVVASVQAISEAFLLPVIEHMLDQFPFRIQGFHSDNGSEYVNHHVARLLGKLHIEFTRSRARKSNDNALVESKNGAVVRKTFGYAHIPQRHAQRFNTLCREVLNPFLNLHRPCLFATEHEDPNKPGRIKRVYRHQDAMTPLEKLASLPQASTYLREGITLETLFQHANKMTDLQAANALNKANSTLFCHVMNQTKQDRNPQSLY